MTTGATERTPLAKAGTIWSNKMHHKALDLPWTHEPTLTYK